MSRAVSVAIHPSQFPENVRRDLVESLRSRQVNHKFHYDSIKQTQKWLALHQAYSPSRTDADCAAIYDKSFVGAASQMDSRQIHLIGLGCGGGQKDSRLLKLLKEQGTEVSYTPSDVSVAMVLVARQTAIATVPDTNCFPFVCDLASADDLGEIFSNVDPHAARLLTFFGMIPNFEPQMILPKLANLMRADDYLLFSANLVPENDYSAGLEKILPLYDNDLTRDWLQSFLTDLGLEKNSGEMRFAIEEIADTGLKRVAAHFHFTEPRTLELPEEKFHFHPGESVRLFFSYRHTPERIVRLLGTYGIDVLDQWIAASGEEGVFFCRKPA